jgi:hypothetical protein
MHQIAGHRGCRQRKQSRNHESAFVENGDLGGRRTENVMPFKEALAEVIRATLVAWGPKLDVPGKKSFE